MTQPNWTPVMNLGDVNPLDHGGLFVFVDLNGEYDPEVEIIEPVDENDDNSDLEIHRFAIPRCSYFGGVLSDNQFHPAHPAWFAKSLADVARFTGETEEVLITLLCSSHPVDRAAAYRDLVSYHGIQNFAEHSRTMTKFAARPRYDSYLRKIKERMSGPYSMLETPVWKGESDDEDD